MFCSIFHKIKSCTLSKMFFFLVASWAIFVCGCSSLSNGKKSESTTGPVITVKGKEGTKHFIIIGFGIVRVKCPEKETAALVTDTQALGISVSDQPGLKFGLGYSSCTVTTVPDGMRADDVRIEVTRKPIGALKVTTHSAKLNDSSMNGGKDNEEK